MYKRQAYDSLMNDEIRENFLRWGNPDGPQAIKYGVALPSFLFDATYQNAVLLTYLTCMVGVIPYLVYKYYDFSSKFGNRNIRYETYDWFHSNLSEHTSLKSLPEVLAGAAE